MPPDNATRSTASNARYVFIFNKLDIVFRFENGTPRIVSTTPLYHEGKSLKMYVQHSRSGVAFALRSDQAYAIDASLWLHLGAEEANGLKFLREIEEGTTVVVVPITGREQEAFEDFLRQIAA
jgi:hypothetical protein